MFKKLFLALLIVGLVSGVAYSAATVTTATKARAAAMDKGMEQVVGVGDVSGGDTLEVDNRGAAYVMQYPQTLAQTGGATLTTGTALVSSALRLSSVTCGGPGTSAGDYVLLWNSATVGSVDDPDIECTVGAAKDTTNIVFPNGGVSFDTGLFVKSASALINLTVTYDQ